MVVYFDEGINRIWYASLTFQTGLVITCYLWDPNLIESGLHTFTEFKEGLYYFDFNFNKRGSWVGLFYENEVKKIPQTFSVGMSRPGIVRYNVRN